MSTSETAQLWLALATLPVAIAFITLFARPSERWWRSWFGVSLMLIAVAVFLSTLLTVFFRLWGPGYYGRSILLVTTQSMTLLAMTMRTLVLAAAQRGEKPFRRRTYH